MRAALAPTADTDKQAGALAVDELVPRARKGLTLRADGAATAGPSTAFASDRAAATGADESHDGAKHGSEAQDAKVTEAAGAGRKAMASIKKRAHALQPTAQARNPFEQAFEVENLAKLPPLTEVRCRSFANAQASKVQPLGV